MVACSIWKLNLHCLSLTLTKFYMVSIKFSSEGTQSILVKNLCGLFTAIPRYAKQFQTYLTSFKMFENIIPGENENNQSKVTLGVGWTFIHGLLGVVMRTEL